MTTRSIVIPLKNFLLCFIVLTGIITICVPSHVWAQTSGKDVFARFEKPMPEFDLPTQEQFIEATTAISKKPYGKDELSYSMRISKKWEEGVDKTASNFTLNEELFVTLSTYYSKPTIDGRSRIEIEALNIESPLTARQWYVQYLLEGGYTTEGFVVHNPDKVESLMVVMEGDASYYLRTLVMVNGAKIFMVKYYVPTVYIQQQAIMQQLVIDSFELETPTSRRYEEMVKNRFLDIAEIQYPKEWKIYIDPIRDAHHLGGRILNVRTVVSDDARSKPATEGKLYVRITSSSVKNTLVEEMASYIKKLKGEGILIEKRIPEDYVFEYDEAMDFALTEVYSVIDGSDSTGEYELWYTVMVGGNYYYFLTLLTSSRNELFATWAENTQYYKRILTKFRPMAGAFLDRD